MIELPLSEALAWVADGRIQDAKSVIGLLLVDQRRRAAGARAVNAVAGDVVAGLLPIEVEDFLSWMVSERGRAANTVTAYRRDLMAYTGWLHECGLDLDAVGTDDIVDYVAARRASGLAAASVARQIAAMRMLHRHLVTEGVRADDPTAELEGVRVPAGIPKPLREADVDALLDAVVGHDPSRGATGHCSSCCTAPGRASPRRAGCRWARSTSTATSCACSARGRRSASCRSAGAPRRRSTSGSRPAAGWC